MIKEINAIMWKEWNDLFFKQNLRNKLRTVLLIIIVGVAMPIHKGANWFVAPFFMGVGFVGAFLMILTTICDLFAGERERHTLETLFASQISDKGFILGKVLFAISYATTITILLVILNIAVINIEYYKGTFIIMSFNTALIITIINFTTALFGAIVGTVVSLRASTVKKAQLTMSVLIIALVFTPTLLISHLPTKIKLLLSHYYSLLGFQTTIYIIGASSLIISTLGLLFILNYFNRLKIFS